MCIFLLFQTGETHFRFILTFLDSCWTFSTRASSTRLMYSKKQLDLFVLLELHVEFITLNYDEVSVSISWYDYLLLSGIV